VRRLGGLLAEAGLRVVGIEGSPVGGECPYWGCVPSKMMIRAANVLAESRRVAQLAGASITTPDWAPVARRIREQATDNWDDTVAVDRFVGKGGIFVRGYARITGPGSVTVNDVAYRASRGIVVAIDTLAAVPPIPGLADTPYWTNHEIIEVEELPTSLVVLGGGAIGVELAQVMARFGVRVTVIEGLDRLLPRDEPEAGSVLGEVFEAEGIAVHIGQFVSPVAFDDGQFTVRMPGGIEIRGEKLLVAAGRRTFLRELCVQALGLDLDAMPSVTFTDTELGADGLTEAEAREHDMSIAVASKPVAHSARLAALDGQRGLHQARRRHRPRRSHRGDHSRSRERRSTRLAHTGGSRPGPSRNAAFDDLCLPDVPQRGGGRSQRPLLTAITRGLQRGRRHA
jgi:pyruvate/2-oxoglutarate dehydrogenase complex dihydrolipoamide dehydrogenase (E3) component